MARGVPTLLYRRELPNRFERRALAFFAATGLPLIVVITHIGVETGQMKPNTAAALVGAGMASIVVFPLLSKALLDRAAAPAPRGRPSMPVGDPSP